MAYDLGDVVPLSITIRDADGSPANATDVALTITLPDGTTETPVVINSTTGVYTCDFEATQSGRHTVRWLATGNNAGAYADVFDVRPETPPYILSLKDAKEKLNISSAADDEEIRGNIEAVTGAIEFLIGPVVRQSVTERHGPGPYLVLHRSPVISVTSVVGIGSTAPTYAVGDMDLDPETGILMFLDGRSFDVPTRVTFVAGRPVVPAPIREAAGIMLIHMWNVQRGSGALPSLGGASDPDFTLRQNWEPVIPGYGYAIPNRALELLGPYLLPPGVG